MPGGDTRQERCTARPRARRSVRTALVAKAAQITVPNHPIMQKPFQEFHFAPVQARFVKLQMLSFHAGGSTPYSGSIQLYASNTNGRF